MAAERIGLGRWRHVVKLDPDKPLPTYTVRRIATSGTDAILIGGTQRVTAFKVAGVLRQLRSAPVPVCIEMSATACAVPGADAYFVPVVLNAGDSRWLIGQHLSGLRLLGNLVPWERVLAEGYVVGNPASAVARRVSARIPAGPGELTALIRYGAGILRLPIVYLEFSGVMASSDLIASAAAAFAAIRKQTGNLRSGGPRLFYGGGLRTFDDTQRMLRMVDTIVVGNALYGPRGLAALEATLAAADRARQEAKCRCPS